MTLRRAWWTVVDPALTEQTLKGLFWLQGCRVEPIPHYPQFSNRSMSRRYVYLSRSLLLPASVLSTHHYLFRLSTNSPCTPSTLLLTLTTCTIDQTCTGRRVTAIRSMPPNHLLSNTRSHIAQAALSVPVRIPTRTGPRSQILPNGEEYKTALLKGTTVGVKFE